jgi:hypothetical protein
MKYERGLTMTDNQPQQPEADIQIRCRYCKEIGGHTAVCILPEQSAVPDAAKLSNEQAIAACSYIEEALYACNTTRIVLDAAAEHAWRSRDYEFDAAFNQVSELKQQLIHLQGELAETTREWHDEMTINAKLKQELVAAKVLVDWANDPEDGMWVRAKQRDTALAQVRELVEKLTGAAGTLHKLGYPVEDIAFVIAKAQHGGGEQG